MPTPRSPHSQKFENAGLYRQQKSCAPIRTLSLVTWPCNVINTNTACSVHVYNIACGFEYCVLEVRKLWPKNNNEIPFEQVEIFLQANLWLSEANLPVTYLPLIRWLISLCSTVLFVCEDTTLPRPGKGSQCCLFEDITSLCVDTLPTRPGKGSRHHHIYQMKSLLVDIQSASC